MSSSINNFISPFYTSIIGNDTNTNELQAEIDDLREDLDNNYYNKIESDERYLNQSSTSKWNLNSVDGTIYPRDYEKVAIGQNKVTAEYDLDVSGTSRTTNLIVSKIKADNSFGSPNQVLKTDGTKVYWDDISGGGGGGEYYWIKTGDEISYKLGDVNIGKNLLINDNNFVKNNVIASAEISYNELIEFGQEITLGTIQSPNGNDVYLSWEATGTAGSQNSTTNVLAGIRIMKNNSYLPLSELYIQTSSQNDNYNLSQNNLLISNSFFPLTIKAFCVGVGDYINNINLNYDLTSEKGLFNIEVQDLFKTDISNELVDISGSLKTRQIIDVNNSHGNFAQVLTKGESGIEWKDMSGNGGLGENYWTLSNNTLSNKVANKVDISGDLLINNNIFTQKTNVIVGNTGSSQELLTGTFNNPSFMAGGETYNLHTINLTKYLSNNSLSVRITGIGATLAGQGVGFLNGGVRVLDKNNTVVLDVKVNNNWLDGIGHFDITGSTTNTILPEQFPLILQQYVIGGGSWIEGLTAYLNFNYQKYTNSIYGFDVNIPTLLSTDISNNKIDISGQINTSSIKPKYIKDISNNTGSNSQILSTTSNGIKWIDLPADSSNWTYTGGDAGGVGQTITNKNSSVVDISGSLKTNTIVMKNYTQRADNNNNLIIDLSNQEFLKLEESLQPFEQTITGTSFTIPYNDRNSQQANTYSTYMIAPSNFPTTGTQTIYITMKTTGNVSNCYNTGPDSRTCELPIPKIDNAMWFEFLDGGLNLLCRQILNGEDYNSNTSYSPFSIEDTFAVDVTSSTFPYVLHYRKPNTQISLENAVTTFTIRYYSEEPVKLMTLNGDMYANNYYGLIHPASLKDSLINCDNVKVGSNTIFLDGLNNKIGVSTSTPQACLDISQNVSNAMKIGDCLFVDTSNNIVSVNGDLSANNVYNKTQVDLSLNNKLNTSTFNSTIANYYNKTQIDTSINTLNIKPTLIQDVSNNTGTSGQILSSTGNSIKWINAPTPSPTSSSSYDFQGSITFRGVSLSAGTPSTNNYIFGEYYSGTSSYNWQMLKLAEATLNPLSSQRVGPLIFLCPTSLSNINGIINLVYAESNTVLFPVTVNVYIYKNTFSNALTTLATNQTQLYNSSFTFTNGGILHNTFPINITGANLSSTDIVYVSFTTSATSSGSTHFSYRYSLTLS